MGTALVKKPLNPSNGVDVSSDYLLGRPYSTKARSFQKSGGRCWAPLTRCVQDKWRWQRRQALEHRVDQLTITRTKFARVLEEPEVVEIP